MRHRHTRAELLELDVQNFGELYNDNPQTVRHMFYRMTTPDLTVPVSKTECGYRRLVQRRCLKCGKKNPCVISGFQIHAQRIPRANQQRPKRYEAALEINHGGCDWAVDLGDEDYDPVACISLRTSGKNWDKY